LDGAITAVVFLGENVFLPSIPPSGDTDVDEGEEDVVGRPTSLFCLSLDGDIDDDDSPSMETGAIFTIASLPPSSGWVSFLIKGRLHALTTGAFVAGVGGRAVLFEGTSTVATIVDVDVEDVALSTVAASPKPESAASTTVVATTGLEPSMLSFRPFQAMIVQ
jgi:hypothetical protein